MQYDLRFMLGKEFLGVWSDTASMGCTARDEGRVFEEMVSSIMHWTGNPVSREC